VEHDVGRRLRAHREQSGISLRELARRLGVSASAISQIETGKSLPSVSRLYAIVTELGMSLDELFTERSEETEASAPQRRSRPSPNRPPAAPPAEGAGGHVQRAGNRKAVELESGVRWERLTPSPDPSADFLFVVYDVGGSSSRGDQFIRHWGREYGLVLSGSLEVTVGFDSYLLRPGDSISFDSTVPHRLRNTGKEPATGVWLVSGRQSDSRTLAFEEGDGKPLT
jgi:transcriptional regulator with XRE-family HTH domain/quercetin dioxygenase-like cupin family protein